MGGNASFLHIIYKEVDNTVENKTIMALQERESRDLKTNLNV